MINNELRQLKIVSIVVLLLYNILTTNRYILTRSLYCTNVIISAFRKVNIISTLEPLVQPLGTIPTLHTSKDFLLIFAICQFAQKWCRGIFILYHNNILRYFYHFIFHFKYATKFTMQLLVGVGSHLIREKVILLFNNMNSFIIKYFAVVVYQSSSNQVKSAQPVTIPDRILLNCLHNVNPLWESCYFLVQPPPKGIQVITKFYLHFDYYKILCFDSYTSTKTNNSKVGNYYSFNIQRAFCWNVSYQTANKGRNNC